MCASFPSSGPEGGRPHFLLAGRAVPYYNGTKNTRVVSSSDRPLEGGLLLKEWKAKLHDLTAIVPRGVMNFLITAFFMAGAYYLSRLLFQFGVENNSALVYVLAVTFVSWLTTGYFYGILASLFSSFCINYYFMYPYSAFSLSYAGYPVAMLSMTAIAIIICTLTSRIKLQALEAEQREQNTKAPYELTERLNQEKNAIQLEAARETIRSNILRSVSHDLRTPLTAISGAAAVLLSSEEPRSEKDVSLLNDIKNDAEALTTMVENLLSITRIQDASVPLKKREEMLEEVAGAHYPPPFPGRQCAVGPLRGHPVPAHGAHAHQAGHRQSAGKRGPPLRGHSAHPAPPVPPGGVGGGGGPGPWHWTVS